MTLPMTNSSASRNVATYLWRIVPYLRPYWRLAAVSALLIVLGGLISLLAPWALKIVVDHGLGRQPLPAWLAHVAGPFASTPARLIAAAVIFGFLIAFLGDLLTVLNSYINTRIEQNMVLDFRSDLFEHAQRLSLAFHDQRRSGMLIYGINFQADAAARLVMAIPPLAQSLITLVGMFWIVFRMDWRLALLSLTVVPFLYYSVGYYITHIQKRLMTVKEMEGESLSIVHEAISMLRVIVAFGRESHEHRRFREQGHRAVGERVKVTVRQTLFTLAVNTTTAAGTALVLGYGAYRASQGKLTVGELLVVLAYIAAVYQPLEAISTTVGSLQDVLMSVKIAFDLLDIEPEIKDAPGAVPIGRVHGAVTFEGVNFSYSGRTDTLNDIDFEAEPGQVVAVVGPTGAGKSTLVSLMPRFYDPKAGRILIDGKDTRGVTLQSLRGQISIVLQEPLLFSGTIAENIRYGRLEASQEEIVEAARAANAHDFIERLPQRYDTMLGERGVTLSGGERQRIAVARAFLKDAPVLVLDEPTSSIDSKTEAVILDALDRLMVGRTTFMIAHRLSTVRKADLILVLDRGRIVERGTHEELMERRGLYRQLHDMQTGPRQKRGRAVLVPDDEVGDDGSPEAAPATGGPA
jgi:ABC-type multidrug transport system fused ATPase/permease subunit